jgi:hypothetical protein
MTKAFRKDQSFAHIRAVDDEVAAWVEKRLASRRRRHMIERIWDRARSLLRVRGLT